MIDKYLSVLTRWFEIPREALHVVASGNGLICGDLQYTDQTNQIISISQYHKVLQH